jgi:hypothetical protein
VGLARTDRLANRWHYRYVMHDCWIGNCWDYLYDYGFISMIAMLVPYELRPKLLAFGCHKCRDEKVFIRREMKNLVSWALLSEVDLQQLIVPDTIRCGWCRRIVTTHFDFGYRE